MLRRARNSRARGHQTLTFPSPSRGWVQSGNIIAAPGDQAEVLDNLIPTAQGARLRGGLIELGDVGAQVERLFTYGGATDTLFAATAVAIFDAEDVGSGAVRSSLTSGDWSTTQISTSGGQFLVGVNGADTGWTYNGTSFANISLTGVASSALSQVWLFKERLFFVEGGTTSAWYLPVESIGGTVTEIDLGSVFSRGGSLLFGATWSVDAGSGLDDVCLFVSDRGEVAVFQGTDPSSASTWGLAGVYQVGPPIDKHAFFRAGGDLAIMTNDGIVAASEALRKDRAALQANALTFPIEDAWQNAIAQRSVVVPITATLWQSGALLLVSTPTTYRNRPVSFVANARTGAWCRVTGWDVRCSAVFNDDLYIADSAGKVFQADTGGTDAGTAYTGVWVPKFKTTDTFVDVNAAGLVHNSSGDLNISLTAFSDYNVGEIDEPATSVVASGSTWGAGVWGSFQWNGIDETRPYTIWGAAYARGYAVAPAISVTSNQTAAYTFEPVIARLRVETGYTL